MQIVLGWLINTRMMILALPMDKYLAYVKEIDVILENRRVDLMKLESIVGKLQHSSYVIPLAGHFLARFRRKIT